MKELAGKRVGIPGFFGASYIGWKALVYTTGINERDVILKQIGFTQVAALQQDIVDAAVVYIVNEPIQLRNAGVDIHVIEVSDKIDLVSNGLVVGETLITSEPELVQGIVRATQRGLLYTIGHPDEAFQIARSIIPEMSDDIAVVQRQVLEASIELLRSDMPGYTSQQAWQDSVGFMRQSGLLDKPVDVNTLYTNRFMK
jgi:NitT/TauT family transport system substrate-binding protein